MKIKLKNVLKKFKLSIPYIILIISNIIFCVAYYIITVLKEVNFYEMIYYFTSDTTGTGPDIILDGIKACFFIFILIMFLILLPISNFKKNISINTKNKKINIYPTIFHEHKLLYSIIILITSVLIIFKTMSFDKFIESRSKTTNIYETYYKKPNNVKVTFPEQKNNLVLVYLESMESSLTSLENGGTFPTSRIRELEDLALENINFSNTEKLGGAYNLTLTSWTLASTVAGTSGTPLLNQKQIKYKEEKRIIPSITTLGDLLEKENYNLEIIQGSNIKFAGVDKYFKAHGNYEIFDINTAKERGYIPSYYNVWWGFEDKKLFEYSKNEILNLASKEEPFAISIFTMDTHFKDGYLDESCEELFEDKLSNSYACSSKMVNEFVSWLKEQDFYENTTIVLIGDHLTMQNEYYNDYPNYTRTIYNAFINSRVNSENTKNREFSSLDMYPTILSSLGAKVEDEQLGFGVNLFSNKKTMIETLGKEKFNTEILKNSKYYIKKILEPQ